MNSYQQKLAKISFLHYDIENKGEGEFLYDF